MTVGPKRSSQADAAPGGTSHPPSRLRRFGGAGVAAAAAALLALYFVLATTAANTKSHTFDEIAHLTAGYAYWTLDDYRLQPENGNLPQRLAALPAVLDGATFPSLEDPDWHRSDVYAFGRTFFFESGNDIDRLLARGRAVIALLAVVLGAIVFAASWRLNGGAGALLSLVFFVFCPTLLAHGAMATSDMAAALAFTVSIWLLWLLLERVTLSRLLGSALAAAALFLSKFSAPVLVLMALVLAAVRLLSPAPLTVRIAGIERIVAGRLQRILLLLGLALVHGAVIWILIWAAYGFRFSAFHEPRPDDRLLVDWTLVLSEPDGTTRSTIGSAIDLARQHRLLPESYLYGFAHTVKFAQSRRAFMDGEHSLTGWTSFFPYAFAIKTPIPLMIAFVIGAVCLARRRDTWTGATPWIVLLGVYWLFAITTNLNIGHRHLLPTYPALFILAGGIGPLIARSAGFHALPPEGTRSAGLQGLPPAAKPKRARRAAPPRRPRQPVRGAVLAATAAGILVTWHAVESFRVRPHYLAYFNQVAGGPEEGYKRLVDSSLDWGQDLPTLRAWLDANLPAGSRPPVYLSYFGTSSPRHFGLDVILLETYLETRPEKKPVALLPGYYCVSATMLQGVYLAVNGPWTAKAEETYRMISTLVQARAAAATPEAVAQLEARTGGRPPEFWSSALTLYDELRTARLMAYLRKRRPDAQAGYSIQIYRLTEDQLSDALEGPAPY